MTVDALPRRSPSSRRTWPLCAALAAALAATAPGATVASAARHEPFGARAGVVVAEAAAQVWAPDAALVYLENDEDVAGAGIAVRWGYLFYSAGLQKARGYSVRDGRVVVAGDLDMKFAAPPLAVQWIDSQAALAAAEAHGGRQYCAAHAGHVGNMLLARGAFQQGAPDLTTWTIVYTSPSAPSLFIVVDAAHGTVCRTWRG